MIKKAITTFAFFLSFMFAALVLGTEARAEVLFEIVDRETLAKGVFYEKVRQVTNDGLRDYHVLSVSLEDPYITLAPAESKTEHSLKEPASGLLSQNGAIAGVNGDFFDMAGKYSATVGPVIAGGVILSAGNDFNTGSRRWASFFIGNDDNPFITYTQSKITFLNDGAYNVDVAAINKVSDMRRAVVITPDAMPDTSQLDARFPNIVKIIVDGGYIERVTKAGETVAIPQNGYVVAMNEATAARVRTGSMFAPGQTAELSVWGGVDFSTIKAAIGGGGQILRYGEIVDDTGYVVAGRQPRTAIGITEDRKRVILMVIDGRTHSIGATHEETANLLLRYGAYQAMHLDGGGSSTMAVKRPDEDAPSVVNTLSEGAERKVSNALGVFSNAPVGAMVELAISSSTKDVIFKNMPTKIDVYALDEYFNRIDAPPGETVINCDDAGGVWMGGYYYPSRLGDVNIIASFQDLYASVYFECRVLAELRANVEDGGGTSPLHPVIETSEGSAVPIIFTGVDTTGAETDISWGVMSEVIPPGLGYVRDNVLYAVSSGTGHIKCTAGNVNTYVGLIVGGLEMNFHSFEGDAGEYGFSGYPDSVSGGAGITAAEKTDGHFAGRLGYYMPLSETTQAAYFNFTEPLLIPGEPVGLKLAVFGDGSNLWLRGRIKDADGDTFAITFANEIDWYGWKYASAKLPDGCVYPIELECVYVAALSTVKDIAGEIYFDTLKVVYPFEDVSFSFPETPQFVDPLAVELSGMIADGSYDLVFTGDTWDAGTDAVRSRTEGARAVFILGEGAPGDDGQIGGVPAFWHGGAYGLLEAENTLVIRMTASDGGLVRTDMYQWARFSGDIQATDKDHIIIILDKNPFAFRQKKEFEMFADELSRLGKGGGEAADGAHENNKKNIFVISADGPETESVARGGVRFINLGSYLDGDGELNPDFKTVRFRINGNDIRYEIS